GAAARLPETGPAVLRRGAGRAQRPHAHGRRRESRQRWPDPAGRADDAAALQTVRPRGRHPLPGVSAREWDAGKGTLPRRRQLQLLLLAAIIWRHMRIITAAG